MLRMQERRCARELCNTQVRITMDELLPDQISIMNSSDSLTYTHTHTLARHTTLPELRRRKQQLHRNNLLLLLLSLPPRLLCVAARHKFVFTQHMNCGKTQ